VTTGFTYAGTELDALAGARNYYAAIIDQFRPFFGRRVLEAGAGIGTFARHVLDAVAPETMMLIEPAGNNLPMLRARFLGDHRVGVRAGYLEDLAPVPRVDSVVAVNVLEHIEDDRRFLRAAYAAIAPGGHVLLYVPALRQLYGSLDEAFQHVRRYTKAAVLERLRGAGFEPVRVRYTNLPGVISWFLAGRIFRRRTITARDVALYDRVVMPWVTAIERWWEPWVGQSIIAIARRP
jgi:SAM-dependent methyltransferase